jgi:hypothetical protein
MEHKKAGSFVGLDKKEEETNTNPSILQPQDALPEEPQKQSTHDTS